ncbi:MAG: methyltransferase domain-containing protein [Polyangiaceae bacterium]|nr:methyltransferase domain-containing protein [Polyangiaceae bacterium]
MTHTHPAAQQSVAADERRRSLRSLWLSHLKRCTLGRLMVDDHMAEDEWWHDFYSEAWPAIQGDGYPTERTSRECDVIVDLLHLTAGANVLDIPCGIGRHTVELARRGFRLTGIDLKAQFVEQARASALRAGVAPTLLVSDMREFSSAERFDAAFCFFGSFGYFYGDGDVTFLRAVSRVLAPGAHFLIHTHTMETLLPIHRERDWFWADPPRNSRRVIEERSWNIEAGRIEAKWTVLDGNRTTCSRTSIRMYCFPELRALLESAGFEGVEARDAKTGEPLRIGAAPAAIISRRSTY